MDDNQELSKQDLWDEFDAQDGDAGTTHEVSSTSSKEEAAAPEAAKPQGEAAKGEKAADPYEGMSQQARDELLGMRTMLVQLQSRTRHAEGKIGELNSLLKQSAQKVSDDGGDAPSARELKEATGNPGKFAKLRENYPEFAEAMQEEIERRDSAAAETISALRAEVTETRQSVDETIRRARVEQIHPNWETTITTPLFRGWYEQQPPEIKMLADSPEPAAAIRVLSLFDEAHGTKRPTPDTDLESAAALPSSRRSAPRTKPIEEMTEKELWAHYDAQDAAAARAARR